MRPCARWLLSLTLTALVLAVWPRRAQADPLDPTSFTSLGANPFTTPETYTIDTSVTPPVLTTPAPYHGREKETPGRPTHPSG
jgi:hypothetical protein